MCSRKVITQRNPVAERNSWELVPSSHEAAQQDPYVLRDPRGGGAFFRWFKESRVPKSRGLRHEQWIAERLRFAAVMLRESIEVNPRKRGGVPVLNGTRVPVAQILAEIADDASVSEIAEELDLDADCIRKLLEGIASYLDRPFFR